MSWLDSIVNRKGFFHHPDTPQEEKDFYLLHKETIPRLLQIGENFIQSDGVLSHRSLPRGKTELGTGAKFLHRGFYCPSPALDLWISNAKRGKILVRPSERSHITNRYVFDTSGRLLFLDTYSEDKMLSSEYLLYLDSAIYGVTVGMDGRLDCVSEELYENGRLESYICAYYSWYGQDADCWKMDCEQYFYDELGLLDWELWELDYGIEMVAPSGLIRHSRFRFARKDGWLESFIRIDPDGTPPENACVIQVKVKRKADVIRSDSSSAI